MSVNPTSVDRLISNFRKTSDIREFYGSIRFMESRRAMPCIECDPINARYGVFEKIRLPVASSIREQHSLPVSAPIDTVNEPAYRAHR